MLGRILDDNVDLTWIEEPTIEGDYAGHASIGAAIRTPIQTGENWLGLADMAAAVSVGASSFGMLDIMKIGGVTDWLRARRLP